MAKKDVKKSVEIKNVIEDIGLPVEIEDVIEDIGALTENDVISENKEIDYLRSEVSDLKELVKAMLLAQVQNKQETTSNKNNIDANRWVKVVHLDERAEGLSTHVKLSTRPLDFSFFGEEKLVRFTEFEEMVGKYKHWFENGTLVLGEEDSDLVDKYRIMNISQTLLKKDHLDNIKRLNLGQLEDLYKKVSESHKRLITRKFVHGYYELKDVAYGDRKKIDLLNELSGGALQNMYNDLVEKSKIKK